MTDYKILGYVFIAVSPSVNNTNVSQVLLIIQDMLSVKQSDNEIFSDIIFLTHLKVVQTILAVLVFTEVVPKVSKQYLALLC